MADARGPWVLVVGEALVDDVVASGRQRRSYVGGSPLNVAVGLARLGVRTQFASQVADDLNGDRIRQHLSESGAAFRALRPLLARTSTAVATPVDGSRVAYELDVEWHPEAMPELDGHAALHVGSLGAVLGPGCAQVVALAEAARERGVVVCFDPNVRLAAGLTPADWRRAVERVLPAATLVKMSDEDAAVLEPGIPPADVAAGMARDGRIVIVTCGERGAFAATPRHQCHTPARAGLVVDTVGAGDSFMSAAIAWLARAGWPSPSELTTTDLDGLISFATTAAGIACSRPGADPPWIRELSYAWQPSRISAQHDPHHALRPCLDNQETR